LSDAVRSSVSINFGTPADMVDIRVYLAINKKDSFPPGGSIIVVHQRKTTWRQLSRPKKFPRLGEDFQKRKNKSHRPDMTRTAPTEGNFENSEDFILVCGRVTVDELLRNLASTAVLYVQLITPTCNSRSNEKKRDLVRLTQSQLPKCTPHTSFMAVL